MKYQGSIETSKKIESLDAADAAGVVKDAAQDARDETNEDTIAVLQAMIASGSPGTGLKVRKIQLAADEGNTGVHTPATGFSLPAHCAVVDVILRVRSAEVTGASKVLNVGTVEGAGSEFMAGVDVSSIGLKRGQALVTAGATETYFDTNTRGSRLCDFHAGSNVANAYGLYREKPDMQSSGEEVEWSHAGADWVEFEADLYIIYIEMA